MTTAKTIISKHQKKIRSNHKETMVKSKKKSQSQHKYKNPNQKLPNQLAWASTFLSIYPLLAKQNLRVLH